MPENRLAYVLRRTAAINVSVKMEQVVELIGEEKANELALFVNKTSETRRGRVGPRSLIPANKRVYSSNLAQFNIKQLLEAINEAKGEDFQATEPGDEPPPANALPREDLLSQEKKQELKARGLLKPEQKPE